MINMQEDFDIIHVYINININIATKKDMYIV